MCEKPMRLSLEIIISHILHSIFYCFIYKLIPQFIFYLSDPPDVRLDGKMPTVEYTILNITCKVNGGNPSDPRSFSYMWMHRPTYVDTYIPLNGRSKVFRWLELNSTSIVLFEFSNTRAGELT